MLVGNLKLGGWIITSCGGMQELAAEVIYEITMPVSLPDLPLVAPQLHQERELRQE